MPSRGTHSGGTGRRARRGAWAVGWGAECAERRASRNAVDGAPDVADTPRGPGARRADGTGPRAALARGRPRGHRLSPVAVGPAARATPKVTGQTGAGSRAQTGSRA